MFSYRSNRIEILLNFSLRKSCYQNLTLTPLRQSFVEHNNNNNNNNQPPLSSREFFWTPPPPTRDTTHGRRPSPPAAQPPPPEHAAVSAERNHQSRSELARGERARIQPPRCVVETSEERQTLAMSPPFEACRWVCSQTRGEGGVSSSLVSSWKFLNRDQGGGVVLERGFFW